MIENRALRSHRLSGRHVEAGWANAGTSETRGLTVKAIVCREFGPAEKLVYDDVEPPDLGADQVRVGVEACGVNFPDTLIIEGKYQYRPDPPFSPGAEVAGRVIEVGAGVRHVRVGDRVIAFVSWGGYAEQVVAPGGRVIPAAKGMDAKTAAAFPMVYGTAYHALVQRGELKKSETLLVLGAAGGVGLAAVELGKLMGARVIAAASSDEKLALCKEYGADELIDYSAGSLKERVRALTGGNGADVIFDPVGGDAFDQSLSAINWKGRILVVGFAGGRIPKAAVNRILLKGCSVVGVFWGAFMEREPAQGRENFLQLYEWFEAGRIRPHISRVYPLRDAARALNDLTSRTTTGKLVLTVE